MVARILIGSFLLLAAGLKVHGLSQPGLSHAGPSSAGLSRPVFDGAFLSSPQMQLAVVEAEIVIGCLLLWGRYARLAWLAAISFFLLVGGVSLYVALTGQRYCPACFGVVRVPSWATFGLDAGIVAVLAVCRPSRGERFPWRGAGILAAGAAVLSAALLVFTSDRALAALRGQRISVTPAVSDLGDGRAGERRTFEIQLTNHAATAIRVVGAAKSCGCDPSHDLPVALAPGESRSISVQMGFAGGAGRFQHSLRLFTDQPAQPVVTARFSGRVIE